MLRKLNSQTMCILFFVSYFSLQASQDQGPREPLLNWLGFSSQSSAFVHFNKSSYSQLDVEQSQVVAVQTQQKREEIKKAIDEAEVQIKTIETNLHARIPTVSPVNYQTGLVEQNRILKSLLVQYPLQKKPSWFDFSSSNFKYKKLPLKSASSTVKATDYLVQENLYLVQQVKILRLQYQENETL